VSKKSKDKSSRRSEQYEYDPTEVSLPPSTPSETSRDGDFEDARGTRRSSTRDSGIFNSEDRGESRSVVSAGTSRYDDSEPRKKKKSRSGTSDFDDTRSVASAPAGDDYDERKGKKKDKKSGGIFSGLFGSKSESGVRDESPKRSKDDFEDVKKKSKKSKRSSVPDSSSIYGDMGSISVNDLTRTVSNGHSNGNGSYAYDEGNDDPIRSDGEKRKKTRSRSESTSSKKESFLDKAGTLGAGVGLAGVTVAAIAAQQHHQQSKAENANSSTAVEQTVPRHSDQLLERDEILDPEITRRQFRPSIDPQYGDLLPLPPSDPASPNVEPLDDLPNLPDSRPDTPESERLAREKIRNPIRRNVQDTPMKSPSQSQVPLKFKMGGNRSIPSSPSANRVSPLPSPANASQESLAFPRHRSRPTSWDNSKEFKPLYLVESTRRGSNVQLLADDEPLPELPPSQRTSRSSSQLDDAEKSLTGAQDRGFDPLSIDTTLASAAGSADLLGSGQSTPKANDPQAFHDVMETPKQPRLSDAITDDAKFASPTQTKHSSSFGEDAANIAAAAGLASTIGYFASTPSHPKISDSWLNELPSVKGQQSFKDVPTSARHLSSVDDLIPGEARPYPVDPVSKDRSSYLLRSSPMSKRSDDFESNDQDTGSPISKQEKVLSRDTLDSIEEKSGDLEVGDLVHDINEDREMTLEKLSGSKKDSTLHSDSRETGEGSEDFGSKKSKKDKKKDKKKKGLSHSDTQDDLSLPDPPSAAFPDATLPIESEPVEDLFSSKSKKDKKSKKKNKFASWEENEAAPQETSGPSLPIARDEPDSDMFFDAEQGPSETTISEEVTIQQDDFPTPKGKKGKKDKKDKKKSAFAWEPEANESRAEPIERPWPDSLQMPIDAPISREVQQDVAPVQSSAEIVTSLADTHVQMPLAVLGSQDPDREPLIIKEKVPEPSQIIVEEKSTSTTAPEEQDDEFPSKKKGKKDKRRSKAMSDWAEPVENKTLEQTQEPLPDLTPDFVSNPVEATPAEEFFSSKSKKDKKKDKKKAKETFWEAEQEMTPQVDPAQKEDISGTAGEVIVLNDTDEFDNFSTPKLKGKKGKKSKVAPWDSELDTHAADGLQTTTEASREVDDDNLVPAEEPQSIDDFTSISKKDKKKKQKNKSLSPWDVEAKIKSRLASESVSESGSDAQTIAEPFTELSSSKKKDSKKDNRKGKTALSWEPDSNDTETQPALESLTDDMPVLVKESSPSLETTVVAVKPDEKNSTATDIFQDTAQELEQPSVIPTTSSLHTTEDIDTSALSKSEGSDLVTDTKPDDLPAVVLDQITPSDDFGGAETKKSQKKKGQSTMSWADEVESSFPESSKLDNDQAQKSITVPVDDFGSAESKKSKKKKKNKSASTWDQDEEAAQAQSSLEIEDPVFPTSVSKKDKKKAKRLQQWEEPQTMQEQGPATETDKIVDMGAFDDFTASSAKKSKKKSKKNQSFGDDEKDGPEETSKSTDAGNSLPGSETPLSRPTPLGGPGGWPITPATPLTGGEQPSGEAPSSTSKGYFPAAAAAVSAAIFGSKTSQEYSSGIGKDMSMDDPGLTCTGADEPTKMGTESRPLPDGLAAGYDNDQLSLARRLQEEFGKKKSSKKDKKKRQSLPSTPDGLPSRSRALDDDSEGHPRARSLSIGPAVDRSAISPATSERKNVYSEDQLELARQLKADFESGSKKSKNKKGKKGRSTQDDDLFDEDFDPDVPRNSDEQVVPMVEENATAAEISDGSKPDGFAAGYQEDQLSLARQLHADFAKKASKKDKKRRSTSQTPIEDEPWNDDLGDQTQYPGSEPISSRDNPAQPEAIVNEELPLRDGLTLGYKADQLELARQLKEEFGSGSKKKSKDKKDKKRGSLIRSSTEDDYPSDPISGSTDVQPISDTLKQDSTGNPDADDDFATIGKKSKGKKNKKGKRGSLLSSTADEVLSSESGLEEPTSSQAALPRAVLGEELSAEPTSTEPEDEFVSVGKKDKKSKKGRNRDSLLRSTTDDDSPEDFAKQVESLHDASEDKPSESQVMEPPVADHEEEFGFSTKKSKKDKKKRQSSTPVDDIIDRSIDDSQPLPTEVLSIVDTAETVSTEVIAEPEDDFGFPSSKKKDKKKKRGSLLRNESFNINSEEQYEDPGKLAEADSHRDASPAPVIAEQQDDFDFSLSKKSKKDKKKRGSLLRNESFNANREEQVEGSYLQPQPGNDPDSGAATIATPVDDEQHDHAEHFSIDSKQDQESLSTGATLKDFPDPHSQHSVVGVEAETMGGSASTINHVDRVADFEIEPKKVSKDKNNKRKSTQQIFDIEDSVKNLDESSSSKDPIPSDGDVKSETQNQVSINDLSSASATTNALDEKNVPAQTVSQIENEKPEELFKDLAFTKKSKEKEKDKDKNRNDSMVTGSEDPSGFSTPLLDPLSEPKMVDEMSLPTESVSENTPLSGHEDQSLNASVTPADEPVDDWDAFSTKKSKKKKRKDSSKPDSEGISIPSEPILEPSKDVALTPLPLDQIAVDNVMLEPRGLESTTTTSQKETEDPTDEWSSISVKKTNKKDKKKQKGSSNTGFEGLSGSATPLELNAEASQPTSAIFPDNIEIKSDIEQGQGQASDESKLVATDETEELIGERGSFSTKKTKKGKKDKKSGSSTPIEQLVAPTATEVFTHKTDESNSHNLQEVIDVVDDWGPVSSKKSKKAGKSKKSGYSTPAEEVLTSVPERSSLNDFDDSPLPTEPVPEVPKQFTEQSKEAEDPFLVTDDKSILPDPVDEWESRSSKKSKDKKKKRGFGLSSPIEETLPPVPEQPGAEKFGQFSTMNDLSFDDVAKTGLFGEATVAVEEQGDEWGDFSSKKSKKKKDKKQKNSDLSTPPEEVPTPGQVVHGVSQVGMSTESMSEATAPIENFTESKGASEAQNDDWASVSVKSFKKDRKKQKSGFSEPVDEVFVSRLDEKPAETRDISEPANASVIDTLQNQQSGDAQASEVLEDQADDLGAFPVKSSKKGKKDKAKRSSGMSTPVEQSVLPLSEQVTPDTNVTSIQPGSSDQATSESIEPLANVEAKEAILDQEDEWGSFSVKQPKGKSKKNRKSGLSSPIEDSLPHNEVELVSSEPVQQAALLPAAPAALGPEQAIETLNDQDEWGSFSAPKSKKDKKKSRQSEISSSVADLSPEQQPEPPAEPTQNLAAGLNNVETHKQQKLDDGHADEWALTSKKSKDKKKKSSKLSTPVEQPSPSIAQVAPPESTDALDAVMDEAQSSTQAAEIEVLEDEWGTSPKKNKKDKKKSAFSALHELPSSPVDIQGAIDPFQQAQNAPGEAEPMQEPSAKTDGQVDDEWGSFSMKKGKKDKKDKKRKSGLSTPVEQISEVLSKQEVSDPAEKQIVAEQILPESNEPLGRNLENDLAPIGDPAGEWTFSPKQKSKKDKKRKATLSTAINDAQVLDEATIRSDDASTQPIIADSEGIERDLPAHDDNAKDQAWKITEEKDAKIQEPPTEDDAFGFVSKKSKKSKKEKRKSGLATPIEQEQVLEKPVPAGAIIQSEPSLVKDQDERQSSFAHDEDEQVQQPIDEVFDLISKKSKDKKGKRESRASSESGPSAPAQQKLDENEIASTSLDVAPALSSITLDHEAEEQDLFTSDLSRKLSKKDKRKRQTIVDVASDSKGPSNTPLTSWADAVEEAEVVRAVPVIEEIAKDESLSHIAPTVETIPVDDFVRPSKKGKKGTKRNSVSTESAPVAESFQSSEGRDLPGDSSPSHIAAIVATGAAVAGAALLSKTGTSHDESGATKGGSSSGTTTPTRKLSKKEKRKKSIDRRAPREDDIFDDPALWEGADPKVHEEAKDGDDDSDGFWSPPQDDNKPSTAQEVIQDDNIEKGQPVAIAPTETIRPKSPTAATLPKLQSTDPHILTLNEPSFVPELNPTSSHEIPESDQILEKSQPPSNPSDEFIISSKKKDKKKKKKGNSDHWEPEASQDPDAVPLVTQSSTFDTPTIIDAPVDREVTFDRLPSISQEHISPPPKELFEQQQSNRDISAQEDFEVVQPRPQSRSFHSRISDLPVVHEESSTQLESEDFHRHDTDANRDSAFVTGSPIPPQRGFADSHEHIRDSGVHLRDFSPAEKARAPIKSTDEAIARLSWPSIDEESETVNLHAPQKSKDVKHHVEERSSAGSYDSKRPKGESATDFYRVQRLTPTKHYDEGTTSRDLLPSQRDKEEKHTDLQRTSTIHGLRKAEGQSLVKQRMQQFQQIESPDLPRTPRPKASSSHSSERLKTESPKDGYSESPTVRAVERSQSGRPRDDNHSDVPFPRSLEKHKDDKYSETPPKSDRPKEAKYPELTSSSRPKAEPPKGITEIEAGAALAGASLGFAAARKLSQEQRPTSAQSQRSTSNSNINRLRTPDIKRPDSVTSNRSGTPPLRRSDRKSGDLRSLSQRSKADLAKEAELATSATPTPAVNTANPTANEGRVRAKDMADVYVSQTATTFANIADMWITGWLW